MHLFTTNAMTLDFLLLIFPGWVVMFLDSHHTVSTFRRFSKLLTQGYRYHKLRRNLWKVLWVILWFSVQIWCNIVSRSHVCIKRNHSPALLRWSKEGQRWNEFHIFGLENSETPSTSTWPSDHREDERYYAWPFYSLVYRSFLTRCTLTNKAVGTIWRALSQPPQRRQGPDPRPFWLPVGTSAFGPELACRLPVAHPTLMDVPIYFNIMLYHYICMCTTFYDLSALVGCWSSVSLRRVISKVLNVCPFDYTAVAWALVNRFNNTSGVTAVTPTDRPKSVRNRCVIEVFGGFFHVVTLLFWIFLWV